MRKWPLHLVPLDNTTMRKYSEDRERIQLIFHSDVMKNSRRGLVVTFLCFPYLCIRPTQHTHTYTHLCSAPQFNIWRWVNIEGARWPLVPCAAGKTVSCSCCVGMIIEMVKSGALVSVKAHHVQLKAQTLCAHASNRQVDCSTAFFFFFNLHSGSTGRVTFHVG